MLESQMQYSWIWEVIAMTNSIKLRAALRQLLMSSSKAGLDTGSLSTVAPQYIAITKNTFIEWHIYLTGMWVNQVKYQQCQLLEEFSPSVTSFEGKWKKPLKLRKSVFQTLENVFHYIYEMHQVRICPKYPSYTYDVWADLLVQML